MNRRELLLGAGSSAIGSAAGAAGVLVVGKAVSATAEEACPGITKAAVTPEERVQAAIAELKAALVAVEPRIVGWRITKIESMGDDSMCPFILGAFTEGVPS